MEYPKNSTPTPGPDDISKLFKIRLNELIAEGDFSLFHYAEGLLDAKGLSLPKGEDVEKRSALRVLNGEGVVKRAVVRVMHGLDDENGKMPRPEDLKDLESFRKYFHNLLADVVESMVPKELIERIKADTRQIIKEFGPMSNLDFGLNAESVAWVENYLEHLRKSGAFKDNKLKSQVADLFGSFLGECVIECYGGKWENGEFGWCVAFDRGSVVFPVARVAKQIENGIEDGIGSFFRGIAIVFAGHVKKVSGLAQTLAGLSAEEVTALEFAALLPPDQVVLPWLHTLVSGKHSRQANDAEAWQRLVARLVSLSLLVPGQGADKPLDGTQQPRVLQCPRPVQDFMRGRITADEKAAHDEAIGALVTERIAILEETTQGEAARWELEALGSLANFWEETKHPLAGLGADIDFLTMGYQRQGIRSHHYQFAHQNLRELIREAREPYVSIFFDFSPYQADTLPVLHDFLHETWDTVGDCLSEEERLPAEGLEVTRCDLAGGYQIVVITMPPAKWGGEAYMIGIAYRPERPLPSGKGLPVLRYFTLEFALSTRPPYPVSTMLCEWVEDSHLNHGQGPPARVDSFCEAVERYLKC